MTKQARSSTTSLIGGLDTGAALNGVAPFSITHTRRIMRGPTYVTQHETFVAEFITPESLSFDAPKHPSGSFSNSNLNHGSRNGRKSQ